MPVLLASLVAGVARIRKFWKRARDEFALWARVSAGRLVSDRHSQIGDAALRGIGAMMVVWLTVLLRHARACPKRCVYLTGRRAWLW